MSKFRAIRHLLASTGGGGSVVTYDTSVGNGVDANGFASLPLYTPGSDGADLATATPTLDSGSVTYNSGTRTLTDTGSGPIARWTGILTIGQSYHVVMNVTISSFAQLVIMNESGGTQYTSAYEGTGTSKTFLIDAVFTATGHDFILQRTNDVFTGAIQMVKVAANTGGVGGRRFYVRPSTGSDSNNGTQAQSASTPLVTVAAALRFVQSGRGDQILIAQGETLTRGLANFASLGGASATYPLVVQSYDPADSTNEAKLGRATGSNRPAIAGGGADMVNGIISSGTGVSAAPYIAMRGLKFDAAGAGNVEANIAMGSTGGTLDYLLFENNEWAGVQINIQGNNASSKANHIVVRNSSFHGQYDSAVRGDAQGLYAAFTNLATIEDCVFYNCGWKEGANYSDSYTIGGASIYGHPFYLQDDTRNSTVRRSVFIRNANDGGRPKGDCDYYQNLVLNSSIGVNGGGGNGYTVDAASGVNLQIRYNAILGGDPVNAGSWGVHVTNAASGSSAHHNAIGQSTQGGGTALMTDAEEDDTGHANSCTMLWDHNNVHTSWGSSKAEATSGTVGTFSGVPYDNTALIHTTYTNNLWSDATSGSNTSSSGHSWTNAYTVTSLIATAYADLSTAQTAWLSDPASHGWRPLTKLALQGYDVDISAMPYIG